MYKKIIWFTNIQRTSSVVFQRWRNKRVPVWQHLYVLTGTSFFTPDCPLVHKTTNSSYITLLINTLRFDLSIVSTFTLQVCQTFSRLSLWGHDSTLALHPERAELWRLQPAAWGAPSLGTLILWCPPPLEVRREVKALLIQLFFASWRSLARIPFWCSSSCTKMKQAWRCGL